jgi:hypothetical protein
MLHLGDNCDGRDVSVFRILEVKVGIPRRRWKYDIKMDVKELGNNSLFQHRDEGRNCVKMVPELRFTQMTGYLLIGDLLGCGLLHGVYYLRQFYYF